MPENLQEVCPITPGARLVGPAFTVKCDPGSIITVHKALMEAPPGVVLVVDDEGDTRGALWGEVMTYQARRQGILGLVADGGGVVIIPRDQCQAVLERAEAVLHRDEGFIRAIAEGKLLVDLLNFRELITGGK